MAVLIDLERTKQIFDLLKQTTNQSVVGEFLKTKGIPSSGTWDALWTKRIVPAVQNYVITNDELVAMLRSSEESGRQHIFLYKVRSGVKAEELFDRERVSKAATKLGMDDLLIEPRILDQPVKPTFADIRWHKETVDLSLTIKEVYGHEGREFSHEVRDAEARTVTRIYILKKERAVNVVRLDRKGNLEVRLSSRTTGSTKYSDDLKAFWQRVTPFLAQADFTPVPLKKAKRRLVAERATLKSRFRSSNARLKNGNGTTMVMGTGNEDLDDLYEDDGASHGSAAFLAVDDGYCEASNFYVKKNSTLSRDIHVIMAGEVNEFALTADCTSADYDYVLDEIRSLNK